MVGSATTDFTFNAAGQRVSIWNGATGAQIQGQYYWSSKPVAFYKSSATHFQHQDWLGTERLRTTYNGAVEGTYTSLPFGDAQTTASGTDLDQYHYAQLDYDSETNSSHAQFRQYNSTQGRWMRPDPYSGSYDFSNPQSMNRYAYVLNNPLSFVDPSGLDDDCVNDPSVPCTITVNGGCNDDDPVACGWVPQYSSEYCQTRNTYCFIGGGGGGGGGGSAPSKGTCTAQRILSGLMGAANLGLAINKAPELGAAVWALSATGAGAPAAAVLAVYGTTSIFGQGLSGTAQLYSAATGNYGTPVQVAQLGSILSGPVSGLGTLVAGGSLASAERNAGYESMFTAGSGFVQALSSMNGVSAIVNNLDAFITHVGMQPGASGGCGSGD